MLIHSISKMGGGSTVCLCLWAGRGRRGAEKTKAVAQGSVYSFQENFVRQRLKCIWGPKISESHKKIMRLTHTFGSINVLNYR